jgi:hypothetical protein
MARAPRSLAGADLLETLDGTAEVSLVTGAVVDVSGQSRVALGAVERGSGTLSERLTLSSGKVNVHVPKLSPGSKLMVGTFDATVTVHGTAFTVEVARAPDGSRATIVVVTEGRVSVDSGGRQLLLGPGAHWSSAPRAAEPTAPLAGTASADATPGEPGPPPSAASSGRRSTLAVENELFRAAMKAERNGDPERAVTLTERLLRDHPGTPLSGEARVLRAEALSRLGRQPSP